MMLGSRGAEQLEFFAGSLRDLIPDDHVLARVDRVLDLSWLRAEVTELYCPDNGRPGIDPEAAIRLMLAGFLLGIVHDRKLMREVHSTWRSAGLRVSVSPTVCPTIRA
jgi:transposase